MDTRAHERAGSPLHGLVSRVARSSRPDTTARITRAVLAASVAVILLVGLAGGLWRLGIAGVAGMFAHPAGAALAGQAMSSHAALMISGFFGSLIGLERAVALRRAEAFAVPVMSLAGALCLVAGADATGSLLGWLAASLFVGVNAVLVARQPAAHTRLLLVAAVAGWAGNTAYLLRAEPGAVLPWWFGFLVLTIAAERLEMTRLARRRAAAAPLLRVVVSCLLAGCAVAWPLPWLSGLMFGASLVLLSAWLLTFDIARRTVLADGLSRYMAVCLLTGYAWLGVAGLAWLLTALGLPLRDAALHALGLGFVFSMVMGHAPVILPALVRIKLLYGPWFYGPLALLHLSLMVRLLGGSLGGPGWRATGAVLNAAVLALFAMTVISSAIAWRRRHGAEDGAMMPSNQAG